MGGQSLFNPRNVFISWNHKDRVVKDNICSFIREGGYTVWESDLECAGSITEVCLGNIWFCDIFLILLTENSLKSQWVRAELEEAMKLPDAKRRILPFIIGSEAVIKEAGTFFPDISYIHILSASGLPDIKKKLLTSITYLVLDHCFTVYRDSFLDENIRIPLYNNRTYSVKPADPGKSGYAVKADTDLSDLYISRKLYEMTDFQNTGVVLSEEELLESVGNAVIIGESGSGKSQYMRRFAAVAAGQADYLVFLISCGAFARSGLTLTEYLYRQFKQRTGSGKYTAEQFYALLKLKEEHVVILLDGVDEIIEETPQMLRKIVDFWGQYQALRFIFTTRNRQDADQIESYGIRANQYKLNNFDEREAGSFITKLFTAFHERGREEAFCRELENVEEQIRSNPLLLGQLVLLYFSTGSIPDTETKIFDLTTEILVNDIDKEHDIFDSFTEAECNLVRHALPDILKKLAYEKCLDRSENRLSENEEIVAEILCTDYGYQGRKGDALAAAGKITAYLQRRYILAGSEFSHKMWLEYFAAVWLYDAAYRRGKLAGGELLRSYFAEHYKERYWEKITELFLSRADDKFVLADGSIDQQRYEELYDIILSENKGDYGLLFRAARLWKNRVYVCHLLVRDIVAKTVQRDLPAYGQLFCYIPGEKLYELLLAEADRLCPLLAEQERIVLLSLVRDVCYIYGGFVSAGQIEGETQASARLADYASRYSTSPRAALNGMFYKADLPWLKGYIKEQENSRVYPFCFNVYAVSVCDGTGFGDYELDEVFEDELSLYRETQCGEDGHFVGLVSVPYCWEEMRCNFRPGFYSDMTGLILLPSGETVLKRSPVMLNRVQVLYLPGSIRKYRKYALAGLGKETDGVRISIAYGIVWNIFFKTEESEFAYSGMQHIGTVDSMFVPKSVMGIPEGLYRNNHRVTHFPFHGTDLRLGKEVFQNCKALRTVEIPSGITSVGDRAFQGCSRLESVTIPESVGYIGEGAFEDCVSLTSIVIPGSCRIRASAFRNCSGLKSVAILAYIERIEKNTFAGCRNLEEIRLPVSMKEIGENAFKDCRNLKAVFRGEEKWEVFYDENRGRVCLKDKGGVEEKETEDRDIENEKLRLQYKIFRKLKEEYAWREGKNDSVEFPEGITFVAKGSCKGLVSIRRVFLPRSVTEIRERAFYGCIRLLDISIPHGVTWIGNHAFAGCFELTDIEIPDTVEGIKGDAFNGCASIIKLRIPDSVRKIESGAFANCCSLKEVILGSGIKIIEREVFGNCYSLTSLVLPEEIIEIKRQAFLHCWSLVSIEIPERVVKIESEAFLGCKRLVHITLPGSVEELGSGVFQGCVCLQTVDLPEGLLKMGISVFENCKGLSEIRLPERLTEIKDYTFRNCESLETIKLPESLKKIGCYVFSACNRLRDIEIPQTVEEIGYGAFSGCKELASVRLPERITVIEGSAFSGCSSLEEMEIPETVEAINSCAFMDCSKLRIVSIPDGVMEIGSQVFSKCVGLAEIRLPDSVIEIGRAACSGCSGMTGVALPEAITELKEFVFESCGSLERIRIPETVKRIGEGTFQNCESLSEIAIPHGVMEIGRGAFAGCRNLLEIDLPEGLTEIADETFSGCSSLRSISLPEGIKEIGWEAFAHCQCLQEIELSEGIIQIGDRSFEGCSELKSITLPESVRIIGKKAFSDCTSLREIVLPEKITEIEKEVFAGCSSLKRLAIPKGVERIAEGIVAGCSSLEQIELPEGLEYVSGFLFADCVDLKYVTIPENVKAIGRGAFQNCESLSEIVIPESVVEIGEEAFTGCRSLTAVKLPEHLTTLGSNLFADCSCLKSVSLPEQISEIGAGAFRNCSALVSFEFPKGLTAIREETFSGCTALRELYIPILVDEISPGGFAGCKLSKVTIHKKFQGMLGILFGNVISCTQHPGEPEMLVAEFGTL